MISYFKYTDKGPRTDNEDSLKIDDTSNFFIACLADGVGGEKCGKLASETVVEYFIEKVSSFGDDLRIIVSETHERIKSIQKNKPDCFGMATTFTGCVIKDNFLKGVHVGDTRLCILRGNGIKQLTESHTEVQRLVKSGKLKFEDVETYPRKHILENAIGINSQLEIQSFNFRLVQGDRILLTSDGIHDIISKIEFRDLSKNYAHLNRFGDNIIKLLKTKKIRDNVSIILIEFNPQLS